MKEVKSANGEIYLAEFNSLTGKNSRGQTPQEVSDANYQAYHWRVEANRVSREKSQSGCLCFFILPFLPLAYAVGRIIIG